MLMKKLLKFNKERVKAICIGTILAGIIFTSSNSFAMQLEAEFSKDYLEWASSDTKNVYDMPRTYAIDVPSDVLNEINVSSISSVLEGYGANVRKLQPMSAVSTDDRYNLAEVINVPVKDQMLTNECWAFALMSSLESNNLIKRGTTDDYSERHMDYATSKSFTDGENPFAFNRNVGAGGLSGVGLAYLTNGQGAILEKDMPFENNENKISISALKKDVVRVVTDYEVLPTIFKTKKTDGTIMYSDALGAVYTEEQVQAIRNYIKAAIIEHGAVASVTAGGYAEYYSNPSEPMKSKAYFCDKYDIVRDHAITIVGWDDNYSKDNFNPKHRPKNDGAYIVLNSYGTQSFDNGFMYVSYEDVLIETDLYVIQNSKEKDYDNIYQYDEFGGMFAVGSASQDRGLYSAVYKRDINKKETLETVGITVEDYVNVEIYLNPIDSNMSQSSLTLVGSTNDYLEPGYHEIKVESTELKGEEFAIVVKQYSKTGKFYVTIETSSRGSVYANVKSSGNTYVSLDGEEWTKTNELVVPGLEMENADACIKAFTKDLIVKEVLTSEVYKIDLDKIYKIEYNTNKNDFMEKLTSDYTMQILDETGKNITELEEEPIIRTGMKLKLDNGNEYTLAVRGDINCDGKVSLVDLSKIILEYNETKDFRLKGVELYGADLNCDGKVSLVDISQLLVIYMQI